MGEITHRVGEITQSIAHGLDTQRVPLLVNCFNPYGYRKVVADFRNGNKIAQSIDTMGIPVLMRRCANAALPPFFGIRHRRALKPEKNEAQKLLQTMGRREQVLKNEAQKLLKTQENTKFHRNYHWAPGSPAALLLMGY